MNRSIAVVLFVLPLVTSAPSWAETDIPLPPFSAIDVNGGADVVIHHGATQRVTLVKGRTDATDMKVVGGKLVIETCKHFFSCPWHYDVKIEIVLSRVDGIAVHGGGALTAKGEFPRQPHLFVQAHGGGDIDVRAIPVDKVEAQVHGGGDIHLGHVGALKAEAHGGGDVTFQGNPQPLQTKIYGGGDVSQE
jgi:hypothetical protein